MFIKCANALNSKTSTIFKITILPDIVITLPKGTDTQVSWVFSQPQNYGLFSWLLTYNYVGSIIGNIEEFTNTNIKGFFRITDMTRTITFKCRIHWLLNGTFSMT